MQLDLSAARFFLFSLMLTLCSQVTFAQRDLDEALLLASPDMIAADSALKSHMEMLATEAVSNHCAACHGANLAGQSGVPNLVDYDWLWGVSGFEMTQSEAVYDVIANGRTESCPAWSQTLNAATIKALSVYIYNQFMGY